VFSFVVSLFFAERSNYRSDDPLEQGRNWVSSGSQGIFSWMVRGPRGMFCWDVNHVVSLLDCVFVLAERSGMMVDDPLEHVQHRNIHLKMEIFSYGLFMSK